MTSSVGALSCFTTARFLILPSLSSDSIHHFSCTSSSRLLFGTGTDSPALSSSGTMGSTPPTCNTCEPRPKEEMQDTMRQFYLPVGPP